MRRRLAWAAPLALLSSAGIAWTNFEAILPGFEHEIAQLDPLKYRAAKKRERKEEKKQRQEGDRKDERASLQP